MDKAKSTSLDEKKQSDDDEQMLNMRQIEVIEEMIADDDERSPSRGPERSSHNGRRLSAQVESIQNAKEKLGGGQEGEKIES